MWLQALAAIRVDTPPKALEAIYTKLPGRFPPLYECLVLSYRWAEVDLQSYRLLANPPGPDLSGLLEELSKDSILGNGLLRAGYVRFGMGPDTDYDPVCFDANSRRKDGDCRIVKFDHEENLCNDRVNVTSELASTFEQLVVRTIEAADQHNKISR